MPTPFPYIVATLFSSVVCVCFLVISYRILLNMDVQFPTELAALQTKVGLPDAARVYLTTSDPPVRELAQVALIGEDIELIAQVLRE